MSAFGLHGLHVEEARPLAPLTSLGLGGQAQYFVEAQTRAQLCAAVAYARSSGLGCYVLGGGSNVVVADAGVEGLVLRVATRGITRSPNDPSVLEVEAGEPFENVVEAAIGWGLGGLECLAGIPGSTGATPVQNVGAYGQEVAETIEAVEVLERSTGSVSWLPNAACGFSYRDSALKHVPGRFVVLAVRFRLVPGAAPAPRYAELVRALAGNSAPTHRDIADAVRALRRTKSMLLDPADPNGKSVGSFFTNPIVSADQAHEVRRRAAYLAAPVDPAEVPAFSAPNGCVKLSAGWLIEHAGVRRGERFGQVGVSTAHALCLVHHGGGTTAELLGLAARIEAAVRHTFDVTLTREPVLWGTPSAACAASSDQA